MGSMACDIGSIYVSAVLEQVVTKFPNVFARWRHTDFVIVYHGSN